MPQPKILVYGYGNPGRQDDGLGISLVEMIEDWKNKKKLSYIETDSNYQLNIEDAYNIVKRLLGLAYFWCGSQNAVEMQVWATWLLYVILIDLTDAVAEALNKPFAAISIEMVYRSLYFFTTARQRGETNDVVVYLAAEAKFLSILKRKHKGENPSPLVFIPNLLTELSSP